MRLIFIFLLGLLFFLIIGCGSGINVQSDYDKGENFEEYKKYDFMELPENRRGDQLVFKRIQAAIADELEKKGLTRDESDPDFQIAIHTKVKDKLSVTDWGYSYAPYGAYWGGYGYWGGSRMDVYSYEEGTLIIDFVEAADDQMIWRGVAQGTLPENPSAEKRDQLIKEVVKQIMKQYPPKR
jgi:hypothetical protein